MSSGPRSRPGALPLAFRPLVPILDARGINEQAQRMACHQSAPAYEAAAAGRIGLITVVDPLAPFPGGAVKLAERVGAPVLIIVAGDPPWAPGSPPGGWLCARRLAAWARYAAVHASPDPDDYRYAVDAAVRFGRAVLVEATEATAPAWSALLADAASSAPRDAGATH